MTRRVSGTSLSMCCWPSAVAAAAALTVIATSVKPLGAATTWLVSFTIDGTSADGVNVTADQPASYMDYRIAQDPHPSPCVEASPVPAGELHAVFNRKIDPVGTRCNPAGSDRQFRISIGAQGACTRLFNSYGPSAVVMNAIDECELVYNDNPRVRVGKLFAKATRTPVAFLTMMDGNPVSYEIRTTTDATITAIGPNTRLVTFMGTARLLEFRPGTTEFVEEPFDLKHQMTFTRQAQ